MSSLSIKCPLLYFLHIGMILVVLASIAKTEEPQKIPVIYSTDLFQPPEDPDDHYDLAILAGLEELELKALIFDLGTAHRNTEEIGITALNQMAKITGHPSPPWKIGLRNPLRSPDDKALDQPDEFQGGVELILSTLEQSDEKVVMFMVGSCRDFAVAFNRNPDLLRQKVKAVYVNAGNGPGGKQTEWNVALDPNAYLGLMNSGLPIYWCPCFTDVFQPPSHKEIAEGKAYCTYFIVPNQAKLLASTRKEVKNYFVYALDKSSEEPLGFLDRQPNPLPVTSRNMWCTGPFLHAACREIYQTQDGCWIACTSDVAKKHSKNIDKIEIFRFDPISFKPVLKTENGKPVPEFQETTNGDFPSVQIFRYVHPDYNEIMPSVLTSLLETL